MAGRLLNPSDQTNLQTKQRYIQKQITDFFWPDSFLKFLILKVSP